MRPTFITVAAASVAVLPIFSGPALAQANRTFVSGSGSDANPCTLSAPCRSFAGAITQTNAGGEIVVLDSAGYGAVTITKSISINAPDGIEGGVTVASVTDAIDINIGAGDVVNLRGLTLNGGGAAGQDGINFNHLGALNIQNCVVRGFQFGIAFVPTGTAALNVSDTIVSNVRGGIAVQPVTAGTVTAAFNRVQAIGGEEGFLIDGIGLTGGVINVTIANSATTNSGIGLDIESNSGGAATQVVISNSILSNNGTGLLETGANSFSFLAKNTLAGNTTAFTQLNSGALFSFGDNYIAANGNDGGAITLVSAK